VALCVLHVDRRARQARLDRRDYIGMVSGLPPSGGGALREEEGDVFAVLAVGDRFTTGAAAGRQRAYQNRAADAGDRQGAPSFATKLPHELGCSVLVVRRSNSAVNAVGPARCRAPEPCELSNPKATSLPSNACLPS